MPRSAPRPWRARWLAVAIGLSIALPATADTPAKKKKPRNRVADCASFDQRDRADENGVDFTIASRCEPKLACGIKWTLTCSPGTKKAARTREGAAFELENGQSDGASASADRCGPDGWEISDITWSCEPLP
jgi:hypothetical protein